MTAGAAPIRAVAALGVVLILAVPAPTPAVPVMVAVVTVGKPNATKLGKLIGYLESI